MTKRNVPQKLRRMPYQGEWNSKLWSDYLAAREEILESIFYVTKQEDISDAELAKIAKLSANTVSRLAHYQTKEPRFSTVFKLCKAVGLNIGASQLKLFTGEKRKKNNRKVG